MGSRKAVKIILRDFAWITAGSLLTALAINLFLVPYKIAPGGLSGIATVIYHLSGGRFNVGTTMLVLNIPLFIAGYRFIGRKFVVRTLYGAVALSLLIDFSAGFLRDLGEKYLSRLEDLQYSDPDILLYSIFGGVLMGLGLGMVFKVGATTGGSDLAARILNHFVPGFTIGQVLLLIDTSIIIFAAIAFESFQLALYAIVTLFVSSKLIDALLEGVNFAKAVFIISEKSEIIAQRILVELDRGVTALQGTGMYTGNGKKVLLCVLDRGQLPVLRSLVKSEDEKAFVILADVREVLGEGFKSHDQI